MPHVRLEGPLPGSGTTVLRRTVKLRCLAGKQTAWMDLSREIGGDGTLAGGDVQNPPCEES